MSVWGKILGGAAGFALGGPLGALIGAVAGHAVDKMSGGTATAETADATKQIAFTIGVIVLGAKLAKADGQVTRDEVDAFKQVFRIPPEEMKNVGRVFDQARKNAGGYEPLCQAAGPHVRRQPRGPGRTPGRPLPHRPGRRDRECGRTRLSGKPGGHLRFRCP